MANDEQKKIFARNLTYYINLNQKQQVDVANDLDINTTTLNMWCNGNSMPGAGKIRALADYFGIGMSDLIDVHDESDPDMEYSDAVMKIGQYDARFKKIIIEYSKLPVAKKNLLCDFFENFVF